MTMLSHFAATGGNIPLYIEDVFSTYLYTGTGVSSAQTITNGIDLAGKGGLVWIKSRSYVANNLLEDTVRGTGQVLFSNLSSANNNYSTNAITAFGASGFTVGASSGWEANDAGQTYSSWTFRKQPKFFDVVTWTGDGVAGRQIPHNLGSVPGCIIVKKTNSTANWQVYHRSLANTQYLVLNLTNAVTTGLGRWNSTTPTETVFTVGADTTVNASGDTYVAYLFAHDAGGFGPNGTDNVISCGTFTTNASGAANISLGYETQWLLTKSTSTSDAWVIFDTMRGMSQTGVSMLLPNSAAGSTDVNGSNYCAPTATGFSVNDNNVAAFSPNQTYIYVAIRRPMKVPTTGTSVFSVNAQTGVGSSAGQTLTTNFPVDLALSSGRSVNSGSYFIDRLRGTQRYLISASTNSESNFTNWTPLIAFDNNTGIKDANYGSTSNTYVAWSLRRAPGFFDEVCYTGTGANRTVSHSLGAVPELMIVKRRNGAAENWYVYHSALGAGSFINLDLTAIPTSSGQAWNNTAPTSSVFSLGSLGGVNSNTNTFVAYLFASCPGVSNIGSYTGNGSSQTINCGFTGGARFVLIKRTDSTGDWYVWDTARGIVSANDPHLSLNTTAAEVTTNDSIDTNSTGFVVNQVAATNINVNGATYIYLAIA